MGVGVGLVEGLELHENVLTEDEEARLVHFLRTLEAQGREGQVRMTTKMRTGDVLCGLSAFRSSQQIMLVTVFKWDTMVVGVAWVGDVKQDPRCVHTFVCNSSIRHTCCESVHIKLQQALLVRLHDYALQKDVSC